ncbi:hypothetical protein BJ912DRAFT_944584 [Pholiota molesta]|nr:hypothetical protein BJ912DRAFT_944584 [Pholiota molesta]
MDYTPAVATTCESLPIEVVELIVDEVSTERLTLGSCLSVSRSFRHCSLRHLYKSVEILVEEQSQESAMIRISALSQIISPPSCLDIEGVGCYIKTFVLSFQPWRLGRFWDSPANSTELFRLMGDKNLLAVIRGLRGEGYGVQQFYLHVIPHRPINLAELPEEFCATFQSLTQSPYLKTLQVQNMTFLPQMQCVYDIHLKYFQPEIVNPEFSSKQSFGVRAGGDNNQLERLYTDHSFPHENISPEVLRTLKKLVTYNDGPDDVAKTWEIAQMAALSLRTVCIFHSDAKTRASDLSNLGQIPNLEHFSYIQSKSSLTSPFHNAPGFSSNLEMIHRLLQVNHPMRFLRTLNFDIAIPSIKVGMIYLPDTNIGDLWKSIDSILAGENYPSLSKIQLDFHIYVIDSPHRPGNLKEALTRSLEKKFPCLSSSPRISFKMDVRELKL